jgi:surfactin synthase thioesterase subunit
MGLVLAWEVVAQAEEAVGYPSALFVLLFRAPWASSYEWSSAWVPGPKPS